MNLGLRIWIAMLLVAAPCGCTQEERQDAGSPQPSSEGPIDRGRYLLDSEPQGATGVIAARQNAADGQDLVLVGRVGGSKIPWVEGRAAFWMVDLSLTACSDKEADQCPYPWDYCCETEKLPTATALAKIVDEQGGLVTADARTLLGLEELDTVVVRGKAKRDESGNLTILVDRLYVRE